MEQIVLFWDIDGTLLTTGGAGIFAWEDAFEQVTGKKINLSLTQTAGLTDLHIGMNLLEQNGFEAKADVVKKLVTLYEDLLPSNLPKKTGRVLENVREILEALKDKPHVFSMLLTGNTTRGAKAKLTHYQLDQYFSCGAFAEKTHERPAIAQEALKIAKEKFPELIMENTYVIGDTPHDVHCGMAIGARTIAVGSGVYNVSLLEDERPWWAISNLPIHEAFLRKLKLNN